MQKIPWKLSVFRENLSDLKSFKGGILFKSGRVVITKPEMRWEIKRITQAWSFFKKAEKKIPDITKKHFLNEAKKMVESGLMWISIAGTKYFRFYINNSLWAKRMLDNLGDISSTTKAMLKSVKRHEKKRKIVPMNRNEINHLIFSLNRLSGVVEKMKENIRGVMQKEIVGMEGYTKSIITGESKLVTANILKRVMLVDNSYVERFILRIKIGQMIRSELLAEKRMNAIKNSIKKMKFKETRKQIDLLTKDTIKTWSSIRNITTASYSIMLDILSKAKSIEKSLEERRAKFDIPSNLLEFNSKMLNYFKEAFEQALGKMRNINNQLWDIVEKAEAESKESISNLKKAA